MVVSPLPDVCSRAYRFGESKFTIGPDELRYTVAEVTKHLVELYKRTFKLPAASVPRTVFEKVFVFLGSHLDRVGSPEFKDINVDVEFHRHGARLRVTNKMENLWFADWCERNLIIKPSTETAGYEFNSAFYEQYPRDDDPVPRWFTADLKSLVTLLVQILRRLDDPRNGYVTLLGITTCNNERNLLRAVRTDLQLWFTNRSNSAQALVGTLAEILFEGRKDPASFEADIMRTQDRFKYLVRKAYSSVKVLTDLSGECKHKYAVSQRLPQIVQKLDALFAPESDLAEPLRDQYERFFFDVFDLTPYPFNSAVRARLEALSDLCDAFGWLLRSFISEELVGKKNVTERNHSVKKDIARFNQLQQSSTEAEPLFVLDRFDTQLPSAATRLEKLVGLCRQSSAILNKLQSAYELFGAEIQLPLMTPVGQDECAVVYDVIGSARVFNKNEAASAKLALKKEAEKYLRTTLREKVNDKQPDADDSGAYTLRFPENSVRTAVFLRDRAQALGFNVRVGDYYTIGRERFYQSAGGGIKGGSPFEVAARLSTFYKDRNLEQPGESYIFLNHEIVAHLRSTNDRLLQSFEFQWLGALSPRGAGLPDVLVYVLRDRSRPVAARAAL